MPIYEYRCEACGSVQERLLPMGASAKALACDACGKGPLERVPSTFAAPGASSCGPGSGWS